MELEKELKSICKTQTNVDLKKLCSIKIGGVGKYVCYPHSILSLKQLILYLKKNELQYYVLGNGTNIVFEDGEINAVFISLRKLNKIEIKNNSVMAYAGVSLGQLCNRLEKSSLTGLEWAFGIPGSVGGAVAMNAGAFGCEISQFIESIWVLENGKIKKHLPYEMDFSYRYSNLQSSNIIVVKVCFILKNGYFEEIKRKQMEFLNKRMLSQPYGTFNCGSVFKRVNNESAGKVIDKLGLKGAKIGDIQISSKHANFFINMGNATFNDFLNAVKLVKEQAKQSFDIDLQEEVKYIKNIKD